MSVSVDDRFGVAGDPQLPTLPRALDPGAAQGALGRSLPRLAGEDGVVRVRSIRVARYKPGRRCVVEYDVEVERPGEVPEVATLLGKIRRRRSGRSGYRLLSALWEAGFAAGVDDGIAVPEPVGWLPELRMWLQRKVPGRVATDLLPGPDGEALAARIAEAAHKVHRTGVPREPERHHTMADELRILHDCLPQVAELEPRWEERIERLLDASVRLGATAPASRLRWIHRDFYGDQVIVDGDRLWLIDFDEYCEGDPALDAGNFLGAVAEQSLRQLGDPDGLSHVAEALEDRFLELSGEVRRSAVRAYETLTLVRQVYVSTKFAARRPFTGALLELCEERLGIAARAYASR